MAAVIKFENVSKRYRLGSGRGSLREAISSLPRRLVGRAGNPDDDSAYIWALKDVSFEVERGEALGIIGPNGAGKTTALKLLAGITRPTSGRIEVNGKLSALIELGAGFHPDLTGRENVYLNASILGLKKAEIDRLYDDIVEFAELGPFMDTPVKRYSSGMYVRLGFAVAAHVNPDVLLIDEVLAVGDASFQARCLRRIRELKDSGVTIVFVSHNLHSVRVLCDKALLLFQGETVAFGDTEGVITEYLEKPKFKTELEATYKQRDITASSIDKDRKPLTKGKEAEISQVRLLDNHGQEISSIKTGEKLVVRIEYVAYLKIEHPTFTIAFYSIDGTLYAAYTTKFDEYEIEYLEGHGYIDIVFDSLNLLPGLFELSVSIADRDALSTYDWHQRVYRLQVLVGKKGSGLVYLPHYWRLSQNSY